MKKLFADPHFNVMDGLDIYVGDYTQPDPLLCGHAAKMVQRACAGLFDHEKSRPLHRSAGRTGAGCGCCGPNIPPDQSASDDAGRKAPQTWHSPGYATLFPAFLPASLRWPRARPGCGGHASQPYPQ